MTIIQGIILTGMIKTIKGMIAEDMSVGMTTIIVGDFQVKADTSRFGRTGHVDRYSAICV